MNISMIHFIYTFQNFLKRTIILQQEKGIRMYSYVTRMLLLSIRMYPYVSVCRSYGTRMYPCDVLVKILDLSFFS